MPVVLLPPLTFANLVEEIQGLYEDLQNWDNGHPMDGDYQSVEGPDLMVRRQEQEGSG